MDPIPPSLNSKSQVLPKDHFTTTANTFHDNKFPNQDLYNDALSLKQVKPLPSYKVNYIYDVVEKVILLSNNSNTSLNCLDFKNFN